MFVLYLSTNSIALRGFEKNLVECEYAADFPVLAY